MLIPAILCEESDQWSGAVAQLGERLICIQEAAGSIPTSSTTLKRLRCQIRTDAAREARSRCAAAALAFGQGGSNVGPVAQVARARP